MICKSPSTSRSPIRSKIFPGAAIFSQPAWAELACGLRLSRREFQIVCGIFDDLTESNIAANLGISAHTVHTHIERLHRKLAVANRVELVLRITDAFLSLTAAPGSAMPPICGNRAAGRCPLAR